MKKSLPALRTFKARLSRNPEIEVDGKFDAASIDDFYNYLEIAFEALADVDMTGSPVFLFVDEMEVYRGTDEQHRTEMFAMATLVKKIRDLNELLNDQGMFIVAAVRSEVVSLVPEVAYELHRLVRSKGVEADWRSTAASGEIHPLTRTILNRIVVADPDFEGYSTPIPDELLQAAFGKYFQKGAELNSYFKKILDMTWYRPRDLAMLFEEAQRIEGNNQVFSNSTLMRTVQLRLGERMWQDAVSGLAAKYNQQQLRAIDILFRGGPQRYSKPDISRRIIELADMYDDVAIFEESEKLIDVLRDLYRVGVICTISEGSEKKMNFYFRGDPMPSFTSDYMIQIHQTLRRTLAIR